MYSGLRSIERILSFKAVRSKRCMTLQINLTAICLAGLSDFQTFYFSSYYFIFFSQAMYFGTAYCRDFVNFFLILEFLVTQRNLNC